MAPYNGDMKLRTSVVVAIVVIVCFGISAITYATALDRPAESIVAILSSLAGPAIASLFALIKSENNGSTLDVIKKQTNGKLEDIHDRLSSLEEESDK